MNNQASPKPTGRELRRARNVVKKWRESGLVNPPHTDVKVERYKRACAMILAEKLRNS